MSPAVLLGTGLGVLALAIVMLVVVSAPRAGRAGIERAAAAIEQRYVQHTAVVEEAELLSAPGWLRSLALRLSPSGGAAALERRLAIAGNPKRWNSDRILAVKGLGLLGLGPLAGLHGLHSPFTPVLYAGLPFPPPA